MQAGREVFAVSIEESFVFCFFVGGSVIATSFCLKSNDKTTILHLILTYWIFCTIFAVVLILSVLFEIINNYMGRSAKKIAMKSLASFFHLFLCGCEATTEIQDLDNVTTSERLGQIQKIIFQRTKNGTTTNEITIGTTNPNVLATWTALLAAEDDTKVQVTPFIENVTSEAGEPREFGGGTQTLNGIARIVGVEPSTFAGSFYDIPQSLIEKIKKYQCEAGLSVFLVNECNKLIGLTDDHTTPTIFKGIPIQSFFIKDKKFGGYDESDSNDFGWKFAPNWSDKLHIVTPTDFVATELNN